MLPVPEWEKNLCIGVCKACAKSWWYKEIQVSLPKEKHNVKATFIVHLDI